MSDLAANVTWQEILRETEAGDIPHCRAISAPRAFHSEITESLARLILGSSKPSHPDLLIIGTVDKSPPIGDPEKPGYEGSCRWLIENIALKPLESPRRLGVIMCAENLNKNAGNSLLKLAEEPPEHAVLLFLMADGRLFLPTLRSRSRFSTITIHAEEESRKIPQNPSDWITWLAGARKADVEKIAADLRAWANFAAGRRDFVLAEKIEALRIIAERENLSVPMLCDLIILTLKEDTSRYEYILNDIR